MVIIIVDRSPRWVVMPTMNPATTHRPTFREWKLEQERAELERLRQIDAARWKHILDLATASRQAAAVREFLDRMERRTQSEPVDPSLSEKYAKWIGWARCKADQIDPMVQPLTELQLEPEAAG